MKEIAAGSDPARKTRCDEQGQIFLYNIPFQSYRHSYKINTKRHVKIHQKNDTFDSYNPN